MVCSLIKSKPKATIVQKEKSCQVGGTAISGYPLARFAQSTTYAVLTPINSLLCIHLEISLEILINAEGFRAMGSGQREAAWLVNSFH